jgi:hypothetical protein
MDNFGLPSMWSSSLLSLISLHLTGPDAPPDADEAVAETGFKPASEVVVIFIFFTVPNPDIEADVGVGVVVDSDADVGQGSVGDSDNGESALELERELSEESFDEVGLILTLSPPSMRKCWWHQG